MLTLAYDGILVDDFTASEDINYIDEVVISVGTDESITRVIVLKQDALPVDLIIYTLNGNGTITKHGRFFSDRVNFNSHREYRGYNLRSIFGEARYFLEKIGFTFDAC